MGHVYSTYYRDYQQAGEAALPNLLQEAIAYELTGARTYPLIAKMAPTTAEESQLEALRRDERRHHIVLVAIYDELTGIWDEKGECALSLPTIYPEMLKTAICDKLSGVVLYEQLAANLSCAHQKQLICQIMNDEKQHARILAALYEKNLQHQQPIYNTASSWREPDYRPYKY